jgi:hypothetical protein
MASKPSVLTPRPDSENYIIEPACGDMFNDVRTESYTVPVYSYYDTFLKPGLIDPTVPYQREDVWDHTQQCGFVASMVRGCPTQPIILAPVRKKSKKFYPVDGRQRNNTINLWFTSRLKVPFDIKTSEGVLLKRVNLIWSEVSTNPIYAEIYRKLNNYRITYITVEDYMDVDAQTGIFKSVNGGSPLTEYEQCFCSNYFARKVCNAAWALLIQPWDGVFNKKVGGNKRFVGSNAALELWMLTGLRKNNKAPFIDGSEGIYSLNDEEIEALDEGDKDEKRWIGWYNKDQMKEVFSAPDLRKLHRHQTAAAVHAYFKTTGLEFDASHIEFLKHMDTSDMNDKVAVSKALAQVYAQNTTLGLPEGAKKASPRLTRNLLDPLAYFIHLHRSKRFSANDITKNMRAVVKVLKQYHKEKNNGEYAYNMATSDGGTMTAKINLLEHLFVKEFGV